MVRGRSLPSLGWPFGGPSREKRRAQVALFSGERSVFEADAHCLLAGLQLRCWSGKPARSWAHRCSPVASFFGSARPSGMPYFWPVRRADLVRIMSSGWEKMGDPGLSSRVRDVGRLSSFRAGVCWPAPPRSRGNRGLKSQLEGVVRYTPADAGQPWMLLSTALFVTAHPRVRGVTAALDRWSHSPAGTPPGARGNWSPGVSVRPALVGPAPAVAGQLVLSHRGLRTLGHIPAAAGQPLWSGLTDLWIAAHPRFRGAIDRRERAEILFGGNTAG